MNSVSCWLKRTNEKCTKASHVRRGSSRGKDPVAGGKCPSGLIHNSLFCLQAYLQNSQLAIVTWAITMVKFELRTGRQIIDNFADKSQSCEVRSTWDQVTSPC